MNRILFAGTPDLCVPLLRNLAKNFNVVGVLTNCDKRQGRSSALVPSPVKVAATELNIPVLQFDSLKTESREAVTKLGADTLVTFAFGKIFGPKFLSLFPNGTFNVHPSLLPQFRGPSPIQSTILSASDKAYISVQKIGLEMDKGDIFGFCEIPLNGTETTLSLESLVSQKACVFVPEILKQVFENSLEAKPQLGEQSYCFMVDKDQAKIDFNEKAVFVHAKIRAMYPWPKAWTTWKGNTVFITGVSGGFSEIESESMQKDYNHQIKPGTVVCFKKEYGLGVACSDGLVWINKVQVPGKKELDALSFINGNSAILKAVFNE